jgi:hypothetical protein
MRIPLPGGRDLVITKHWIFVPVWGFILAGTLLYMIILAAVTYNAWVEWFGLSSQ